jgi:hypothetical protein
MTPPRAFTAAAPALLLLMLSLAGCRDDLTQVVLVIQSDLSVPADVDGIDVSAVPGPFAPSANQFFSGGQLTAGFPLSVGFLSSGQTTSFSLVVRLFRGVFTASTPALVVSRTVTDVRFADQRTMMLVLPMRRVCACQGTTCPIPGNPECDNIDQPALQPFDPAVAPPSTMMQVGGGGGGVFR